MKNKMIIPPTFATCTCASGDVKTKPSLAVTPADALRMAERGVPVAAANIDSFYDGDVNPSWTISIDRQRGVDVADVWDAQKSARKRIKSAHVSDTYIYGANPSQKTE